MDFPIAVIVFVASAATVIYLGWRLAFYGDVLASLTGWGRLFVGGLLIATATSLPEVATNVSAVRLDPPNPELAVGTVFGANMKNMATLFAVALAFGGKLFFEKVAPQQGYLIVFATFITGLAVLFSAIKFEVDAFDIGLSSAILILVFVAGMWWVYSTRPRQDRDFQDDVNGGVMTLRKTWVMFLGVSAGVVVSGFFLAWSTDQIAETTGISSSTLGILLVSLVTTMPELAAAIAAARMGAMDLGVAGIYGSCAFNMTVLFYADLFYRDGIVLNQAAPAHFVAGGVAIALMLVGLVLILSRNRIRSAVVTAVLSLMAVAYIGAAVVVATLGITEEDNSGENASVLPGRKLNE